MADRTRNNGPGIVKGEEGVWARWIVSPCRVKEKGNKREDVKGTTKIFPSQPRTILSL